MKSFKKFYIEITNVCNLACSFCPQTERGPEFMTLETFSKILDGIRDYAEHIYFHVKGEPLLHPQIDKFLDLSYENGFKVNITTNGTLIRKVKNKLLGKPALRQINFSLHSFDGNENSIGLEEYIGDIISFTREALEKTNTIVALRLWNLREDNLINARLNKNRSILELIEREFNLPYKIEEKITHERGIRILDKFYLNQDHEFSWPDIKGPEEGKGGFCYGLRNQAAILVDGTVVPCCLDGEGVINLGNINESSFGEIIQSVRAKGLIEGFSKREAVEELCRRCGYRRRFD